MDDHPVCVKCKFDLTGRPASSGNCPECGAGLVPGCSIEIGNRQRRPWMMFAGILLAVVAVLPIVTTVGLAVTNFDPVRVEPLWWLLRSSKQIYDHQYCDEIYSRVQGNGLFSSDDQRVVDAGLKLQADIHRPWNPVWGDIIEYLHSKGRVSAADWKIYLAQDEITTIEVRPSIARGDPIPFHIYGELRGASPIKRPGPYHFTELATISGVISQRPLGGGGYGSQFDLEYYLQLKDAQWDRLDAGPQKLVVNLSGVGSVDEATPMLFAPISCQADWNLLPNGQKSARLYRDEELAAKVQQTLSCNVDVGKDGIQLEIKSVSPPTDLAFEVSMRLAGKEWATSDSWIYIDSQAAGFSNRFGSANFPLIPELIGHRADVILRPSIRMAAHAVHMDKVLDHEFVLKDVLIDNSR